MQYCENGTDLSEAWTNGGFSHCFLDTVTTSILVGIILIFGSIQFYIYKRYAAQLSSKLWPKSCLYRFQITFAMILVTEAIIHLILQDTVVSSKRVFGHQVYTGAGYMVVWMYSIVLVIQERTETLPSIPTRGHGLVLLVFWALAFVRENLAFVSWRSDEWFWHLESTSDIVEFTCWLIRYISTLAAFLIGIKAPGIPTAAHYALLNDAEEGTSSQQQSRQQSTWANVFKKLKLMLPYVWPKGDYWLQFIVVICIALLAIGRVVNVYVPLYYKYIVDSLTPVASTATVNDAKLEFRWDLILIYIGLKFVQGGGSGNTGFINNARAFLWIRVQQYTTRRIQIKLFSHLHNLSLRWHLGRKTGEVLRVIDRGTNSINNLLSYVLFNIVPTIADIIIAIIYFVTVFSYIFGIVVFLAMVLYLIVTFSITEWRTKFRREMNLRDNDKNTKSVDSLLNFETVKYYGASEFEIQQYDDAIVLYQTAEWKSTASLNLLNSLQNIVISLGLLVGSMLCAWAVVHGINELQLTVGDFVQFGTYLVQLYGPLNFLGTYYRMIQQAFIDMENMFELLDEEQEVKDIPDAKPLEIRDGRIEFKDVSFHYDPLKTILRDISFTVPPGETYALVGHSGSGKSTIIRLLFRFYDLQQGVITIDGQDIALLQQESLRKCIGVVPQDTVLFNKDIRYNVRYGRVNALDAEVEEAAKNADIHDRILTFPNAYSTMVGERGLKLSGGEKQRVAIARTLLKAPAIILLDEATSALDTQTERNIQASLEKVCENRTTIIVAHRLSTIIHSNSILVMREGEIIERGNHDDLLSRDGHYADMWNQQLSRREETDNVGGDDEHVGTEEE